MQTVYYPDKSEWNGLLTRPSFTRESLMDTVARIMDDVKANGDEALRRYTQQFDKVSLSGFRVTDKELDSALGMCNPALIEAIDIAARNIRKFHSVQLHNDVPVETMPGVKCWREIRPIEKVGLYIPGGSAPLFSSVLMLGIPAIIAGCSRIILCTPPDSNGNINPAIIVAAKHIGINEIYKVGGIQAIAAMTYGTQTVPAVYKILGPGNQYVTAAKQYASTLGVAIDMPAGPSEVLIMADSTCNPAFVASDLLSQAEHGPDSQVILLTCDKTLPGKVEKEIDIQLESLSRKDIAEQSLVHSRIIVLENISDMVEISNAYAPEHLIIAMDSADDIVKDIVNAGSVFLGHYSPESAGDYASGTNHALPTSGYAKAYSGVSVDSFIKKITFQHITRNGFELIGPCIETMASAEFLEAHKFAATIRLKDKKE